MLFQPEGQTQKLLLMQQMTGIHLWLRRCTEQLDLVSGGIRRLTQIMPEFQRVAAGFIHCLGDQRILSAFHRKPIIQLQCLPTAAATVIPQHSIERTIRPPDDHPVVTAVDALPLKLFEKHKAPERRLGNTAIGHQPKATVERRERNSLLLKDIPKRPVGIGLVVISQPGELMRNIRRVLIGVMQRIVGTVGSIVLRNVNLQSPIPVITVNNLAGRMQIGEPQLRRGQFLIEIVSHMIRLFGCIVMARHKIQRNLLLMTVLHERTDPDFIRATADRRTAHPEGRIHTLYRSKRHVEQAKIFLHIGILPKSRKIGLIPNLDGPRAHFIPAIPRNQMLQRSLHQRRPGIIAFGRRGISLPVENGIFVRRHLLRHKAKLQEGAQSQFQITVHHQIQIDCDTFDIPGYAVDDNSQYPTKEGVPYIDTAAAMDEARGEMAIFVINRNWESDNRVELDVSAFEGWSFVEHVQMYSDDIDAVNTWENPDAIQPTINQETTCENGKVQASLKSLSWNVFRFKKTSL